MRRYSTLPLALVLAFSTMGSSRPFTPDPAPGYDYVTLADLALAAPVALAADITSAIPLKAADARGVPDGQTRYYVQATSRALLSGRVDLPPTLSYLVDLPTAANGRPLRLKGTAVLLLAYPPAAGGELRLIGPRAQVPRTPDNEARVRAILEAKLAADAPPAIAGIGRAFHVPGSLPGESETQIFLRTTTGRPISLNVLRRPGEAPRWAVALSEMVDNSAAPPARDTLLWYRLACGLPAILPDTALDGLSDADAQATRSDYQVVLAGLGPCRRG